MNATGQPRIALVTGASKGIGFAIAQRLAQAGYRLLITARSADALEGHASAIAARHGVEIKAYPADLVDPSIAVGAVATALSTFGGLDLLVNCAGATKAGDFLSLTHQDFIDGFALKFHAAVNLTRAAWPHLMRSTSGHVVNIIGMRARTPAAGFAIGGPVNGALLNFTKAMAERGIGDGVRVNGVSPGFVETDRVRILIDALKARENLSEEAAKARLLSEYGLNRFGTPEEIADAVHFLDSQAAAYINGSILDVDGGATKGV